MAEDGGKTKLPQDIIAEIGVEDLYEFLGIESRCSEKEVQIAKSTHLFGHFTNSYILIIFMLDKWCL